MDEVEGEIETLEHKIDVQRRKVSLHTANSEMLMILIIFVALSPLLIGVALWSPNGIYQIDWSRYWAWVAIVAALTTVVSWLALRAQGKAKKARAALIALELENA